MSRIDPTEHVSAGGTRPAARGRPRDGCQYRDGSATAEAVSEQRGAERASRSVEAATLRSTAARDEAILRRRLVGAALLATATITLVLAVPPLRNVAREIAAMNTGWVALSLALEFASCAAFVVIFRLFFDELPAGVARELAWTEEASGALLPTGGVGALAIGGWLLRQRGMSTGAIVRRSSGLFFLTSATNVAALLVGGVLLATSAAGESGTLALALIPITLGVVSTSAVLALPIVRRRRPDLGWPSWLVDITSGIDDARAVLVRPRWRILGAAGYLGFDIAALGATFAATGHSIPIVALVLGYVLGYVANMLPIPGGFGVLEAGLAGTLIAYGAPAAPAAAAVIVYHAVAFWIPSLGGVVGYARLRRRLGVPYAQNPEIRVRGEAILAGGSPP